MATTLASPPNTESNTLRTPSHDTPMAQSLTFRHATPTDVPAVLHLVASAYRGDESKAGWTTEAHFLEGDRINAAGILEKMTAPNGVVLLAHDASGILVACCELLRRDEEMAYFGLFSVTPARQGAGLGKEVLARAELYARDAWGVKTLEMQVIWLRTELIAWYLRRGYRRTGETRPFPHAQVNNRVLVDDVHFEILTKTL